MNITRATLTALACGSALLWGCGDTLPPSPDPSQNTGESFRLAFSELHEDIDNNKDAVVVVMNEDGSGRTEIAHGALVGPAGTDRVAFLRNDSVFVATRENGTWNIRTIYTVPDSTYWISYASVALSPDGRTVTFTTRKLTGSNHYTSTYLAAADGSGIGNPLQMSLANGYTPVFSRDSRKVAFNGIVPNMLRDGTIPTGKICVFNTDGSNYVAAGNIEHVGADGGVSMDFSPDGSRIAYSLKDYDADITTTYVANANGSGTSQVFTTGGYSPVWSHDGSRIFYIGGLNFDIMAKNADGSGTATNLTNTVGQIEMFMQLSPDGEKLVYSLSSRDVEDAPAVIKVMEVDNPSNSATISSIGYRGFWVRNPQ